MSKIYYKESTVKRWIHEMIRSIHQDNWRPDYIVGLTRGGLIPAVMLSHYFEVPMHALGVSFRDGDTGPESNLWMAEDAFGYIPEISRQESGTRFDPALRKNILIVDDINDTGNTLSWIKEDWPSGCLPTDPAWAAVWHRNVRFATLVNNENSRFKEVDYVGERINKLETPVWCVFPWEEFWV